MVRDERGEGNAGEGGGIGTERESSLHRALKFRYAGEGGKTEVGTGEYVCDGLTESGEMVEIQTGSFGPLKVKARELSVRGPLRIVHPIIIDKFIDLYDEGGALLRSRKSPRHGKLWDLFKALVYAPELPRLPNVRIELCPVDIRERRIQDGRGSWRRKGARIEDKSPAAFYPPVLLSGPGDYYRFLPFGEGEEFTRRDLEERAGINASLAGKTLYVLEKLGLTERTGKKGRALVYRLALKAERRGKGEGGGKNKKGRGPRLRKSRSL